MTIARCPVCRQGVETKELDGRTVLVNHYAPGQAPPCRGSNQPVRPEFSQAPRTLFDDR